MSLTVQIEHLDQFINDVKKAGGDARPLVNAALTNSATRIQRNIRQRAPHRTGALQRSVQYEVNYPSAKVEVEEKYGQYIEQGTGVYGPKGTRITPKTAKAMRWNGIGGVVFAKSIKGMKARPFFKPGVEESQLYIRDSFRSVTERLVRELAGRG
jgi:HK97 gp10 family phage protein